MDEIAHVVESLFLAQAIMVKFLVKSHQSYDKRCIAGNISVGPVRFGPPPVPLSGSIFQPCIVYLTISYWKDQ